MTARHEPIAAVLVLALLGALQACKRSEPTDAPAELADDIAQIEAALQRRDGELSDAGVVVAYRAPAASDDAKTEVPIEAPPEPGNRDFTADEGDAAPTAEPQSPVETTDSPTQATPAEQRVDREVERLRARQSARKSRAREKRAMAQDDRGPRTRCEKLCGLAETTCELRDKICELAGEHDDDVRYEAACRRAEDQCSAATEHCVNCAV